MTEGKNLKIKETFVLAFQNHKNRNFNTAENLYKDVLKIDPNHFVRCHVVAEGGLS